ncbi:MAG: hypothetical protein GWN87_05515 [Desulfuromonadales bacterium]|nr:hypothetical protein [Desulfuromonadales bacterium]NIS40054.1 hypothetical protein [Desulfuromonadales bacterium]
MKDTDRDFVPDAALAARLRKALTASSDELYQLVQDASTEVILNILKNPNTAEDHLLSLLKRRDLREEIPRAIYSSERVERTHRLQVALVRNPATPAPLALTLLPHLHLFELVDLLYLPGATPDQKVAAEREITRRLPSVPLGNLITLSRRASHAIVAEILKLGRPDAVAVCLSNPRLKEVGILQFINSGAANAETISMIARHPRWKNRPRLRMAILKHPRTPPVWHTLWLPELKVPQLKELRLSSRLQPAARQRVEAELRNRL